MMLPWYAFSACVTPVFLMIPFITLKWQLLLFHKHGCGRYELRLNVVMIIGTYGVILGWRSAAIGKINAHVK